MPVRLNATFTLYPGNAPFSLRHAPSLLPEARKERRYQREDGQQKSRSLQHLNQRIVKGKIPDEVMFIGIDKSYLGVAASVRETDHGGNNQQQ